MNPKQLLATLAVSAAALGSIHADAATITYDVRAVSTLSQLPDYAAGWAAQGTSITSNALSTFTGAIGLFPGGFNHLTVDFNVGTALPSVNFQLAPDATYGGQLLLDGTALDTKVEDLWWGGNWNAVSELLSGTSLLTSGHHVLEAYWAEDCCSGAQGGRFSLDGTNWLDLSVANLNTLAAVSVPEPGMLTLVGLGLAGIGVSRRRKAG